MPQKSGANLQCDLYVYVHIISLARCVQLIQTARFIPYVRHSFLNLNSENSIKIHWLLTTLHKNKLAPFLLTTVCNAFVITLCNKYFDFKHLVLHWIWMTIKCFTIYCICIYDSIKKTAIALALWWHLQSSWRITKSLCLQNNRDALSGAARIL